MRRRLQRENDDEDDDGGNDNDDDDDDNDCDISNLNLPSAVYLVISKAIVAEQIPEKADSNEI